jgi:glycosyltransferase involved in cell wall biosynthesis/GT2 family glycosyltransferase
MANVALVTHDAQTIQDGRAGGVASFVTHFARLLRQAGDDVTIIFTRQEIHPVLIDQVWRDRYAEWGIRVIELHNTEPSLDRWCDPWTARLSEQVLPHLVGFDIAYFQDWANVAFCAARLNRYSCSTGMPVLVTVLHGPSDWIRVGNQQQPEVPASLHLSYIERYAARHSHFVISPSRYMAEWANANEWALPHPPAILGLPFFPEAHPSEMQPSRTITRLVFFGRLETRKGIDLFVSAIKLLDPAALHSLSSIVLLGPEKEPGHLHRVRAALAALDLSIEHLPNLDRQQAGAFLTQHAPDSLVIIPSIAENFPYVVIEVSLLPGIQLLCSNGGGIPEIFAGQSLNCLFDPHPAALAAKLFDRLTGERTAASPPYDAASANALWLAFHHNALRHTPLSGPAGTNASIDVCIPYFDKPSTLPQLLTALEHQTTQSFGVIVINDGSCPEASAVFDHAESLYTLRGWRFHTQPNAFVDAARNHAASLSNADFLLFIDSDDVPAPDAIERMLSAILYSGDDCLVAAGLLFENLNLPYDLNTGELTTPVLARYTPLGPDLVNALVDPMVLGPSMIIIRRSAFESIGGYRTVRGAAHEDWELQVRLLIAGFRVDVLPEPLLYFRKSATGLSVSSNEYEAKRRLIDTYEDLLNRIGLRGLATTLAALQWQPPPPNTLHHLVGEVLRRKGRQP